MQVGDVVIPVGETVFACGCGRYNCAIVASVEPFALASVDADMLWTCTIAPADVMVLCQAAADIVWKAERRYEGFERFKDELKNIAAEKDGHEGDHHD